MSPDTLPKLFEDKVRNLVDKVALREKHRGVWRPITWKEYYDHVENFALGISSMGFRHQERVSVLGDNCPEWLYADLGIQSVGGVTVGVYPTNSEEQVKYVLSNSDSVFVVVKDQEQLDKVLEIKKDLPLLRKVIVIDMKGVRKYKDPLIISYSDVEKMGRALKEKEPQLFGKMISRTKSDDVALIVYTSGTTGPPKGAMLSHKNITHMLNSFFQALPVFQSDSLVSALPLCHVAERLFSLFIPMKSGCTINFAESVTTLQADMVEISPTIFLTVPRILEKIHSTITVKRQDAHPLKSWIFDRCIPIGEKVAVRELRGEKTNLFLRILYGIAYLAIFRPLRNRLGLLQVRECVSGAAPLSTDIIRFFHAIGVKVKEAYGLTELSGVFTMPKGDDITVGSVGKPLPNIDYKLADDGEILIRGDSVFVGYYKDPVGTNRVLKNGWLHTGDIGRFDENGNLFIVDRKKEIIINAAGKNIAPSEIENRLKFSPYINEAIIIGEARKYITALIQMDYENVANWALRNNIAFTNYKSLARNAKVCELIDNEIQKSNKKLARVEQVKKFAILEKELDQDDNELTATMKVKREIIENKYKDLIDPMY